MKNYGINIDVVTFISMLFLSVKLQNSIKHQRFDSYQLLYISFKGNFLFT